MKWRALTSTACPLKLNGNMLAELVQLLDSVLVMTNKSLETMLGIEVTPVVRLILLVRRKKTPGVFTICTVMSGSGFRIIGMKITKVLLLMVVHGKMKIASSVCLGVVAGIVLLLAVGRLAAVGVPKASVTPALASVF
jgi:hypothetical protein